MFCVMTRDRSASTSAVRAPAAPRRGGLRWWPVLGGADPGHHRGGEAEQPAAPPGPRAAAPAGDLGRRQAMPHLQQQRGVQHVGALDVGGEAEDVDAAARAGPGQYHALAAQRRGQPAEQMRLDPGPRVVDVHFPVGRPVGLRPPRGQQRPVDAVLRHQLGRLGRQRLRFVRGDALGLRLGQQLAHPASSAAAASGPPAPSGRPAG